MSKGSLANDLQVCLDFFLEAPNPVLLYTMRRNHSECWISPAQFVKRIREGTMPFVADVKLSQSSGLLKTSSAPPYVQKSYPSLLQPISGVPLVSVPRGQSLCVDPLPT